MKYPAKVYFILLGASGRVYIGLSSNPKRRFEQHRYLLSVGKHPVEDMQADYDASDSKYVTYGILDEVATKSERFKEHKWQLQYRSYDRKYGYNYKDPTARVETARAEQRKRCVAFHKDRMRRVIYAGKEPPIPLSQKRQEEAKRLAEKAREEAMEAFNALNAMTDAEFEEFLDAIRKGYI